MLKEAHIIYSQAIQRKEIHQIFNSEWAIFTGNTYTIKQSLQPSEWTTGPTVNASALPLLFRIEKKNMVLNE